MFLLMVNSLVAFSWMLGRVAWSDSMRAEERMGRGGVITCECKEEEEDEEECSHSGILTHAP